MNRTEAEKLLRSGVEGVREWNARRSEFNDIVAPHPPPDQTPNPFLLDDGWPKIAAGPNLAGLELLWCKAAGADFSETCLADADFHKVDLCGCNFAGANLIGANLRCCDLSGCDFRDAVLLGATLCGHAVKDYRPTAIRGPSLSMDNNTVTRCYGADFTGAHFGHSLVGRLGGAKGLELTKHYYPSRVVIDEYAGAPDLNEPEQVFLERCGTPPVLLEGLKAHFGAIKFHSCFLSHSSEDKEFADKLYFRLADLRVPCYYAPRHLRAGKHIDAQLNEQIHVREKFILVLSESSMHSHWVETELAQAIKRETDEDRRILFPITVAPFEKVRKWRCVDPDTGKDMAREVRKYFIPDFTGWADPQRFEEAYARLASDLRTNL